MFAPMDDEPGGGASDAPPVPKVILEEVSPLAQATRAMLDTGIRDVRNKGVLMRGVNATPGQLLDLCFSLLDGAAIMPYYFYMCDMIPFSEHCRVSVRTAQQLQHAVMGYLPGFATPRIVCDVPYVGKPIRGEVLRLRNFEFVLCARVVGASPTRIMATHLLPNVIDAWVVLVTLQIGLVVLSEATLGFRLEEAERLADAEGEQWTDLELADQDRYFDLAKERE